MYAPCYISRWLSQYCSSRSSDRCHICTCFTFINDGCQCRATHPAMAVMHELLGRGSLFGCHTYLSLPYPPWRTSPPTGSHSWVDFQSSISNMASCLPSQFSGIRMAVISKLACWENPSDGRHTRVGLLNLFPCDYNDCAGLLNHSSRWLSYLRWLAEPILQVTVISSLACWANPAGDWHACAGLMSQPS